MGSTEQRLPNLYKSQDEKGQRNMSYIIGWSMYGFLQRIVIHNAAMTYQKNEGAK